MVSEYTYEQSVVDGVNVPHDVYTIETDISQKGSKIQPNHGGTDDYAKFGRQA